MAGHVLKIMLENTHPPVWRRIIVPEKITFSELHQMIQIVFGWEEEHLHDFGIPSENIMISNEDDIWGWNNYSEDDTLIEDIFPEYKWIRYTYDFGDNWKHKVFYEKTDEDYDKRYATLLKFKGDNFLEDSGGVWWADEESRTAFDKEMTTERLEKLVCPVHEEPELSASEMKVLKEAQEKLQDLFDNLKQNLERDHKRGETRKKISKMSEKINAWKNCTEECVVEITEGSRTNVQLLEDLGMQEVKDYCKYLQIPTNSSYEKEKLTDLVAREFQSHPKYILYVLYEKEYKELSDWIKSPEKIGRRVFEKSETVIKALDLGLMDVEVEQGPEKECVRFSFASDIQNLFRPLNRQYCRSIYRKLKDFSKALESVVLFYGMLEIESLYGMFCKNYGEIEKETFYRCLYWHERFNNQVQTAYLMDDTSYVAAPQLDAQRILSDTKKYADDLEYVEKPFWLLERVTEDISHRSSWIDALFVNLHYQVGFPEDIAGRIVEDVFTMILDGASLPMILDGVYDTGSEQELFTLCEFWTCIAGIMLEVELPMLKGRSRTEYAEQKGISPWQVGMLEHEETGKNSKEQHMSQFPMDVQEMMYLACNEKNPGELKKLQKYKEEKKVKSEEFLFLLADAYITGDKYKKAEEVIRELRRSSSRGRGEAEFLTGRLEQEQKSEDYDLDYDFPFTGDWYPEPEQVQQPYVRETRKIGRNEPCPCGSGKKYKHCCGK